MPDEDPTAPTLFPVALSKLRPVTIDVAKRINDILGQLEDTKGYATLTVDVANGEPCFLKVERRFKLSMDR
jgi:hypothetical protein